MKKAYYTKSFHKKLIPTLLIAMALLTANAQEHKVRMAFIGNSITYGSGLSNRLEQCYPAQLSALLSDVYGDTCSLFNAGVSGRAMMKNAPSPIWEEEQFEDAIMMVPDICLILLGTNDSKPYLWEDIGDEFLDDYLAMIDTFKFRNPETKFIVCYPTPIWPGQKYGTDWNDLHNDTLLVNNVLPAIDTIVQETGANLIDFYHAFPESERYLFPDSLHPNASAAGQMAQIIFDSLQKWDMIHGVDAGKAFVTDFYASTSPVAAGSEVELTWTTIYADSVFLNDESVAINGSKSVIANADQVYTLKAKNEKYTAEFPITLETYTPEKTKLKLSTSTNSYKHGLPIIFYVDYIDQYNQVMAENTSNVSWSLVDGAGQFGEQTDTSIVFTPGASGLFKIKAEVGGLEIEKSIYAGVSSIENSTAASLKVYPNPVTSTLFFKSDINIADISVKIYNVAGELVLENNATKLTESECFTLDVSELTRGNYVYLVQLDDLAISGQFVKENE